MSTSWVCEVRPSTSSRCSTSYRIASHLSNYAVGPGQPPLQKTQILLPERSSEPSATRGPATTSRANLTWPLIKPSNCVCHVQRVAFHDTAPADVPVPRRSYNFRCPTVGTCPNGPVQWAQWPTPTTAPTSMCEIFFRGGGLSLSL